MQCKWPEKPERVPGLQEDVYFCGFPEVKTVDEGWRVVVKFPTCGQLWLVDYFDKVQSFYAFKIDSPADTERSFFEIHKKFLIEARGGYADKECVMVGCKNKALKELAYCPDCAIEKLHLYE